MAISSDPVMTSGALGPVRGRLRAWQPPVQDPRFWIVQAGVLSLALFHDLVLVDIRDAQHPFGVDDAMSSALLLVPVIYAAVTFGFRGSVATALWATVLIAPHWLFMRPLTRTHLTIEFGNLAILLAVAIVVGLRVESEQRARQRAESSLQIARTAWTRYQSLFDQQPAPVLIADASGSINEVNTAATALLGPIARGSSLQQVLSATPEDLLGAQPPWLCLDTADGDRRLFLPTAHTLDVDGTKRLLQIVLTDVTEQRRRQEEQRLFSGRLLAVQEEERRRLAQELHDDPLQNIMYLTRALDDLSEDKALPPRMLSGIRYGGELAAQAATALRKAIHGLRPPLLDDIGVASALRQLVTEVRKRGTFAVDLECTGTEVGLSPDLKLTAYRIVQESLSNIIRHAHAHHATVSVRFGDPLTLTISDDGRGIAATLAATQGAPDGLGLLGMRERATLAGGTLEVRPRSPHGTVVEAALPTRGPEQVSPMDAIDAAAG